MIWYINFSILKLKLLFFNCTGLRSAEQPDRQWNIWNIAERMWTQHSVAEVEDDIVQIGPLIVIAIEIAIASAVSESIHPMNHNILLYHSIHSAPKYILQEVQSPMGYSF